MKKVTMQEFADMFNVYVAKDKDSGVFAYNKKPSVSYENDGWSIENADTLIVRDITDFIKDKDDVAWDKSLCIPPVKFEEYDKPDVEWIGKIIRNKQFEYTPSIESIGDNFIMTWDDQKIYFDDLFKNYTWADGSPCGQEV